MTRARLHARPSRRCLLRELGGAALAFSAPLVLTRSKLLAWAESVEDGFTPLFDGKTLAGWHKNPARIGHGTGGQWQVQDGAIVGEQDPPGSGNGGILLTDRTFADLELRLEMMPGWGIDSGLFLRANDRGQCIQMMVDYHDGGNVGHLYGEGTGGWNTRPFDLVGRYDENERAKLIGLTTKPTPDYDHHPIVATCTGDEFVKAWRRDDWNAVRVLCTGKYPRVTTWINDLKVCEFDGDTFRHPQYDKEKVFGAIGGEGSIAVQVHGGKGAWPAGLKCRWRNIRVKAI